MSVSIDIQMPKSKGIVYLIVVVGHQGGPHNHTITALAVALKQAQSPEYKVYQQAVLDNSQAFCKRNSNEHRRHTAEL